MTYSVRLYPYVDKQKYDELGRFPTLYHACSFYVSFCDREPGMSEDTVKLVSLDPKLRDVEIDLQLIARQL